MISNSFKEGCIEYTVEMKTAESFPNIDLNDWNDGYIAFSNDEIRVQHIKNRSLKDMLNGRVEGINGIEGYLIEIDLWRNKDGIYEELSIEREDREFLYQGWKLYTQLKENQKHNCYFRVVDTYARANSKIFKDNELKSIEVIFPEHRLHFFITI